MSAGRSVAIFVLGLGALGFGGAGLCGAVFTLTSLPGLFGSQQGDQYATAFLVISVPSLVIGSLLCRWCWRKAQQLNGGDDE